MTREELKEHCKRQVQQFERVEKIMPVTPNDWKRYEEHKLILELLEQEPRWIPVSERQPENYQRVLVTVVNYDGDKVVRVAVYYDLKKIFKIKENMENWKVGEEGLLAWMPLPEPYREVEK